MLCRFWTDVGIVERYLHQPWPAVRDMTLREFRFHQFAARYWRRKEYEASQEE